MNKKTLLSYLIEAVVFIVLIVCVWNYYGKKLDVSEHNINTLKGQLEQVELKNGELVSIRDSYVLKMNELEDELGISKNEIRELRKALNSKVAYIAELEATVRVDTTIIVRDSIIYRDNNDYSAIFNYNDKWLDINGLHEFTNGKSTTTFNKINIYTPLQVGISDNYQIWVKSENPYLEFDDIQGAIIDGSKLKPNKQFINWGFQIGFGLSYDIIDKDLSIGPYAGIGAEINF